MKYFCCGALFGCVLFYWVAIGLGLREPQLFDIYWVVVTSLATGIMAGELKNG